MRAMRGSGEPNAYAYAGVRVVEDLPKPERHHDAKSSAAFEKSPHVTV